MTKEEMIRKISELRGWTVIAKGHHGKKNGSKWIEPLPDWSSDGSWPILLRDMLDAGETVRFHHDGTVWLSKDIYVDGNTAAEIGENLCMVWLMWKGVDVTCIVDSSVSES
jgi:hypothetical protein